MRETDIIYFIEVANSRSLSRASERLGISQPSLSASIKKLEQEVGVVLFNRSKTGVSLTASGQRFLLKSKQLIHYWQALKDSVYDATHKIEGNVTLGCHPVVGMYHLPASLPKLLQDNPKLNIKIIHGLSREINEAIISGRCDIGIVVNPVRHPDLVIKSLRQDKVGFWKSPDYQIKDKLITLLCDPNLHQSADVIKRLKKHGLTLSRMIECQNLELLAKLAAEGLGVAILPQSIAESSYAKTLENYNPDIFYLDDICLVYRNENRFIKAIEAIKNSLQ